MMKPFWAIVNLTIRNALRSHIFQLLLALLLVCVIAIPNTIAGDGTAQGYIQISLKYSLAAVSFMLSLSAVWLGCFSMTQDVESYQLHLVVTKPVSRLVIWLAKWTGVSLVHVVLLLLAAVSIYFTVMWQYSRQDFDVAERERIAQEVLVGRRVFRPDTGELRAEIDQATEKKKREFSRVGEEVGTGEIMELQRMLLARSQEVAYRQTKRWDYSGLPADYNGPVFLRFRVYVAKASSEDQRLTHGQWTYFTVNREYESVSNVNETAKLAGYSFVRDPQPVEQILGGNFIEKELRGNFVSPDGTVRLEYTNFDNFYATGDSVEHANQFFQRADGPRLMIAVSGFASNYFRAVLVLVMQILIFAGLGCAAASFLSLPTAIFVVVSYLLFGSFATYMVGTPFFSGAGDYIGYFVGKALLLVVIPMQNFEVTQYVSTGELVEFSLIGRLFLSYFLLRGVPFFLFGMYCYWKRELGLVIRK